jgi:branched-chain amino acid transport system substrate-binding protein
LRSFLLVVALIALVAPPTARAAEPFTINVIDSLTGYAAFSGMQGQIGLRAVEELTNRSGGINGRPIHFAIVDDGSNPATAVQLANSIVASKAPVILGPLLTSNCESVFPLILENGPVTYCFSPALYPKTGSFGYAAGPSTRDLNVAAMRYFRGRGWKRIAFLNTTDASGQDGEVQVRYALTLPENAGMQLVADEHFAVADLSATAQIARIEASHPDVILTWITGTPTGTALRGIHDSGLDVPVMLNDSNLHVPQLKTYSAFIPKTLLFAGLLSLTPANTKSAAVRDVQRQFTTTLTAQGSAPDLSSSQAFEAARLIVSAFRHEGTQATAQQIRDYINHVRSFPGVNGVMNFSGGNQRGLGLDSVIMVRWNETTASFTPLSHPGGKPL